MTKYTSKLQDKRILVVGGTSGIGFCVAEAAAEHGAIVIIASSRQAKIDAKLQQILKDNPNARVSGYTCDLGDSALAEENVKRLLDCATKDGKLDHIVMTAGDAINAPKLADFTTERMHSVQQVRLMGSMLLAKHSMSYLNISSASSFTLTGGVNTLKPTSGWNVVAAVGASIEGMTRGLAVDMKPIRVNMVGPGAVMTELWEASFGSKEELEQVEKMYLSKLLTGAIGRPEDVAEAYLYLMKDKFVVGQFIYTEGGYLLL